jgi:hypothetical protein
MKRTPLSFPELAIIAGTRAALGAGLGLLLGGSLSESQRRAVGWTLFGVGVITTVPIAIQLFKSDRDAPGIESGRGTRRMVEQEYAI